MIKGEEKMKKIRILQVVPCLTQSNGIAAYISNYYENMDKRDDLEMYFLVFTKSVKDRHEEIEKFGGHIIEIYKDCNVINYIKKLDLVFKKYKFDIIHCHVPNFGAFIMPLARKNKVPIRIIHSHVNRSGETLYKKIRNDFLSKISVIFSNTYFACSNDAGKFLFKNNDFFVINNAIDIKKYSFSDDIREEYRKKLGITDKFVIGEFGRLCNQKNQMFTLDIFSELQKIRQNSVLLLAGDGPLEEKLKKKINLLGLEDKVFLLGSRKDLEKLYNCLDVFLLPSTYEGLGIVLIEAQANGLNCFTSKDCVPQTANVSDLLHYISLEEDSKDWAKSIIEQDLSRKNVDTKIEKSGFNIKMEANKLYDLYENLVKDL